MNKNRFVMLIEEFCELHGVADPMSIVHGNPVKVNGVFFSLIYSEKIDPTLMHIYGDIGAMPGGSEVDAYRRLLRKNFLMSANRVAVYSLSPQTGRVLVSRHDDLAQTTPALLGDRLKALAEEAKTWHTDPLVSYEATDKPSKPLRRIASAAGLNYRQLARN